MILQNWTPRCLWSISVPVLCARRMLSSSSSSSFFRFPYLSLPLQLPRLTQGPLFPPPPPQIQCSLLSRNPMEGPFNYVYTACLCDSNPRTFYWDFEVNSKYRGHSREERSARVGENIKRNVTPDMSRVLGQKGRDKGGKRGE